MKAGIVTITNGPPNFGNILQTYAVQQSLKKLNIDSEVIRNYSFAEYRKSKLYLIPKLILRYPEGVRSIRFDSFSRKYLKTSKEIVTSHQIPDELRTKYDIYICGSDQIWNPMWNLNRNFEVMFLQFASNNRVKISLSASFGINNIPKEYTKQIREGLNEIDFLSVREYEGASIISQIINRKAEVLIDPTLALDKEEWIRVGKKPKWIKTDKYILLYFLGELSENDRKSIQVWREKLKCEIIDLMDKKDSKIYASSPEEFIWLVSNSALVITDSYHGSIFSFIMDTPMVIFLRKDSGNGDMSSRIMTLISKFNLIEHIYDKGGSDLNKYLSNDYHEGKNKLEEEKASYYSFLKKAIFGDMNDRD